MSSSGTSKTWFIVHVLYPLVPFLIEGFIRAVMEVFSTNNLSLETIIETFSASTLAMSIGLLSLFVNQSLHNTMRPLTDEEELEQMRGTAILFLIYAIFSFSIFGILVLLSVEGLSSIPKLETGLKVFQVAVFILAPLPVWFSVSAQKAYKLKASI